MALDHIDRVILLVHNGLIRHDPDFVECIGRNIGGAKTLMSLGVNTVPELFTEIARWVC